MKPVRVVFFIENVAFSRDRRVRQESKALVDAGMQVSVVCPRLKSDPKPPKMSDGVRIYSYYQPWQGRRWTGYFLEYAWSLICSLWIVTWIWLHSGFDVLHAANPPDLFFLIAMPFRLMGKKYVYDQHDASPEVFEVKFQKNSGIAHRLLLFFERCSYQLADLVVVTNESFRRLAMTRGGKAAERIAVVRNGPDLGRFHCGNPRPALKCGASFLGVYVGIMAKQDGVDRVVRAAHHIVHVRGRHDLHFALLGNGDCLDELKQLTKDLNVAAYFTFAGYVGDSDLLAYLSTADVCLAPDPPSALNHLCTTIKIMEYMSCGKPIVSFDLVESRYSAADAAIYVQEDAPGSFGDAILAVVDDPERRQRMGRSGLERVRKDLHWGRSRMCLLRAYDQFTGRVSVGLIPMEQQTASIPGATEIELNDRRSEAIAHGACATPAGESRSVYRGT